MARNNDSASTSGSNDELLTLLENAQIHGSTTDSFDLKYLKEPMVDDADAVQRNTYTLARILDYKAIKMGALEMLADFQEDFEGWGADGFRQLHARVRKALRASIRQKGVYTGKSNGRIDTQLANLLQQEGLMEWDKDELKEAVLDKECLAYRRQQELLRSSKTMPKQNKSKDKESVPEPNSTEEDESKDDNGDESKSDNGKEVEINSKNADGSDNSNDEENEFATDNDVYFVVPPAKIKNRPLEPTKATSFCKLWDKSLNYTGDPYDILDDKVRHFLDTCLTAQIHPSQFHAVFSMVLSKRAKEYFLHGGFRGLTFADMYDKTKKHFDTEINHQQYHTDWTSITFNGIKMSQEGQNKELSEVLQILLDKLQLCQRALGPAYSGEDQLCTNTIRACRGVAEFEFALFNPAKTFERLSAQLRTSLETARQRTLNPQGSQYFVDRKYNRRDDRGRDRDRDRPSKSWVKRCYVCGKTGCFSTKHTEDERHEAKRRYLDGKRYEGRKPHNGEYAVFLVDYEGDPLSAEEEDEYGGRDDASDQYATDEAFTIRGNLIHWSSTKCEHVARSVLASEIYSLSARIRTLCTNALSSSALPMRSGS